MELTLAKGTKDTDCPPGEHLPNFTLVDYLQLCRDGEAEFSISEVARLMGVTRQAIYRWMTMASVSDEEFDGIVDDIWSSGKQPTTTSIADEIKRRTGQARTYVIRCPHCDGVLQTRKR